MRQLPDNQLPIPRPLLAPDTHHNITTFPLTTCNERNHLWPDDYLLRALSQAEGGCALPLPPTDALYPFPALETCLRVATGQ